MGKERLHYIDWAKAIGILLICVGHFLPSGSMLRIFLYAFHVPLFFTISGITVKRAENKSELCERIVKLFKRIIIPYIVWYTLSNVESILAGYKGVYEFLYNLLFLSGRATWNSALWFLPCFFIVSVMANVLLTYIKNKKIIISVGFVMTVLSVIMYLAGIKDFLFGFNKCMLLSGFYLAGCFWKEIERTIKPSYITVAIFIVVGMVYSYINKGAAISILNWNYNNNIVLWLISAYLMVACFITNCKMLPKFRYSGLVSGNTMFIMCSHLWFRRFIEIFFSINSVVLGLVIGLSIFTIYFLFLFILDKFSKNYKSFELLGLKI